MRWEITGEPASRREPDPGTQLKGSEHSLCSWHRGKQSHWLRRIHLETRLQYRSGCRKKASWVTLGTDMSPSHARAEHWLSLKETCNEDVQATRNATFTLRIIASVRGHMCQFLFLRG